jgi:hypothetical protein
VKVSEMSQFIAKTREIQYLWTLQCPRPMAIAEIQEIRDISQLQTNQVKA